MNVPKQPRLGGKGERLTNKINKSQISFVAISIEAMLEYARPTPTCQLCNNTFELDVASFQDKGAMS